MDLRKAILKEHSKKQCSRIVHWVGNHPERFDQLMRLFLAGEYRVTQRAAWPLSYCVLDHPELIQPHIPALLTHLQKPSLHNAVKRNAVRLLQGMDLPKKYEGRVMTLCMNYLASPNEPVAVKAFSLKVLERLSQKYPEILPEIKYLILEQLPRQTAAFKVRARPFLNS
ncbi:MAG: hypothetical protein KGM98_00240 [Bacteroidota bacterium]|nr:hypothetical protein [Bacteroidota bacterium]